MPKLIVTEKGSDKKDIVTFDREGISIGRSEDNKVCLNSNSVSRKHARVLISGEHCFLIDEGSGNGTFLNGVPVKPKEKNILKHGDVISIEDFNLSFNQIDEMLAQSFNEITDTDILEVKLLKKVLKAIDKESIPSIEVQNGSFVGKKFFFQSDVDEAIIGRDESADFEVKEYVISRRHAKISRRGEAFFIEDLGSKNGTFLNNSKVNQSILHDGDRIALGTIVMIFRYPKEVTVDAIKDSVRKQTLPPAAENLAVEEESRPVEGEPTHSGDAQPFEEAFSEETPDDYPLPQPAKERISLSFVEMGLIGIGVLIFIFASISLLNLLLK